MNQLLLRSELHYQLRETNGSTGSGPVSWATIASPGFTDADLSIGMLNVFGPNISTVTNPVRALESPLLTQTCRLKALNGNVNENLPQLLSMSKRVPSSGGSHCVRQVIWWTPGFRTRMEVRGARRKIQEHWLCTYWPTRDSKNLIPSQVPQKTARCSQYLPTETLCLITIRYK